MRNLIRTPLTWLVVAEFVVVGALIAVVWNVAGGAAKDAPSAASLSLPSPTADTSSQLPDLRETGRPGLRGPMPGLNLDSAFWRDRLRDLNRDQVVFVQLEWRLVHAAMDALHRYLETVVLPSIQAAEKAGGVPVP